ncbi:MAG: DUF3943 domain-containing protein [Candidatus Delongbacteria bacterium]|jgi:hypothetical protein|nr:DUF3943 domain-containing protein [Candidatus Delongbacteria bacterium]
MSKKIFTLFTLLFVLLMTVNGQLVTSEESQTKNYLKPIGQIFALNCGIAATNRYIRDVDYGKISFKTIETNLLNPWVWDADNFTVNQIGHPYQGKLYYTVARQYGHNYFESLVFTAFGSIQWEYFMENERPAINDLITTTLGGAMLGEITARLSNKVLDNSSVGMIRFAREAGAFIINPMKGVHRLIDGRMFTISSKEKKNIKKKIKFEISSEKQIYSLLHSKGIDEDKADSTTSVPFANYNFQMVYGDPFTSKKPFDNFSLNFGFSFKKDIVGNVMARGLIWKKNLGSEKNAHSIFGLIQNFDYLTSQTYKIAASSFGLEFMAERVFFTDWHFLHYHQIGLIALGGASTEYYVEVERDYNLGPGAIVKTGFYFYKDDFAKISIKIDRFWIRTLSGAIGIESVGVGRFEIQKDIYKGIGLAASYVFYDREGIYLSFPDVQVFNHEIRGMLTYNWY